MPPDSDIIALALAEDIGSRRRHLGVFQQSGNSSPRGGLSRGSLALLPGWAWPRKYSAGWMQIWRLSGVCQMAPRVTPGEIAMVVRGRAASLLTAERTALNFLQRLSGVATLTGRFVDAVRRHVGENSRYAEDDVPACAVFEKAAVVAGGAINHRFGLHDMVMVKDNHLAASSSLEELQDAISRVKAERQGIRVELEADTLEQVRKICQVCTEWT